MRGEACERGATEDRLAAFAEEDGVQREARAEGFGDEVFAFEANEFAGAARFSAKGRAQGLYAGVAAARDRGSKVHRPSVCAASCGAFRHADAVQSLLGARRLNADILRINPDEPEPFLIEQVAESLRRGDVVALPTDTFYGLAVDPVNLRAVDNIYDLKSRARHKPLSLLIADVAQGYEIARNIDSGFDKLAEKFWPGPLTIIVKAGSKLPLRVTANTGNVALRVPEAPICRAIVEELGLPITATSANLRGLPECTYANCVREQFGQKIPLIVDGGPTARSVATTIVDLSGGENSWMILREGAIPTHEIALALQR